jgi:cobalt-zinc-cadmium efflux system protein
MADHHHAPTATGRHRRRLVAVLVITACSVGIEVVGGLVSGSLAVLADAGHMLTDLCGLVIAWVASLLADRMPSKHRTFGLQRAEILAALANTLLLFGIAIWVLVEAIRRWNAPATVNGGLMLGVAVFAAGVALTGVLILRSGSDDSLNIRGAYLEVLGDLAGSVAVIIAALVILATGWTRADSIASAVVFVLIVPRAWSLLRSVLNVLLEGTPTGVDLDKVRDHILAVRGVTGVHDLHAWTITSGVPVLSAHVVVDDACCAGGDTERVLDQLGDCLGGHFDVEHCTFQIEPENHQNHEAPQHA